MCRVKNASWHLAKYGAIWHLAKYGAIWHLAKYDAILYSPNNAISLNVQAGFDPSLHPPLAY